MFGEKRDTKNGPAKTGAAARKFLKMGYSSARPHANYKGGRKYDKTSRSMSAALAIQKKRRALQFFFEYWKKAEAMPRYAAGAALVRAAALFSDIALGTKRTASDCSNTI